MLALSLYPSNARMRLPWTVRDSLLSDESINAFASKPRHRLRERPVDPTVKRRKEPQAEIVNLVDGIGRVLLSPTLAPSLQDAEAALAALPTTVYRGPGR